MPWVILSVLTDDCVKPEGARYVEGLPIVVSIPVSTFQGVGAHSDTYLCPKVA